MSLVIRVTEAVPVIISLLNNTRHISTESPSVTTSFSSVLCNTTTVDIRWWRDIKQYYDSVN